MYRELNPSYKRGRHVFVVSLLGHTELARGCESSQGCASSTAWSPLPLTVTLLWVLGMLFLSNYSDSSLWSAAFCPSGWGGGSLDSWWVLSSSGFSDSLPRVSTNGTNLWILIFFLIEKLNILSWFAMGLPGFGMCYMPEVQVWKYAQVYRFSFFLGQYLNSDTLFISTIKNNSFPLWPFADNSRNRTAHPTCDFHCILRGWSQVWLHSVNILCINWYLNKIISLFPHPELLDWKTDSAKSP